jgi:hypothetical protein
VRHRSQSLRRGRLAGAQSLRRCVDVVGTSGGSKLPPTDDYGGLRTLELQLDDLVSELLAARKANGELITSSIGGRSFRTVRKRVLRPHPIMKPKQVEGMLARLYLIEQAIMATLGYTIAGLGVKARHAAYVMSQYWEEPID